MVAPTLLLGRRECGAETAQQSEPSGNGEKEAGFQPVIAVGFLVASNWNGNVWTGRRFWDVAILTRRRREIDHHLIFILKKKEMF